MLGSHQYKNSKAHPLIFEAFVNNQRPLRNIFECLFPIFVLLKFAGRYREPISVLLKCLLSLLVIHAFSTGHHYPGMAAPALQFQLALQDTQLVFLASTMHSPLLYPTLHELSPKLILLRQQLAFRCDSEPHLISTRLIGLLRILPHRMLQQQAPQTLLIHSQISSDLPKILSPSIAQSSAIS